jgi:hypothetical protein
MLNHHHENLSLDEPRRMNSLTTTHNGLSIFEDPP